MTFKPIGEMVRGVTLQACKTESPIEAIMFRAMMMYGRYVLVPEGEEPQGEGVFIFPQYKHGPYRADFLLLARGYKPGARVWPPRCEKKMILECDGAEFHSDPEQVEYDKKRDEYFKEHGFDVLRLTGSSIYRNSHSLAGVIYNDLLTEMQR